MTNQEIKEAIEHLKKDSGNCRQCKTIIDFVQSVLDAKMPEERLVQIGDSDTGFYRSSGAICIHGINISRGDRLCIECANDRGYNQALSDFRLWQAKCLMRLEEVIQNKLGLLNEDRVKELAEKIHNLFGGGEK